MNCYYSNLIEGHNTRPRAIERAPRSPARGNAHIRVQRLIDQRFAAGKLVEDVLRRGEMPRGEATRVTGRSERTARDVLRTLIDAGLLTSETAKGPVQLRFSPSSADALFPRLFPAQVA
jgi:hypothetical protein